MYKRSGIVCVIAGGLTAIAMSFAQDAHADESSFLQAVGNDGLSVGTTALTLGHQVCADILANGVDGVDAEINMGIAAGMSGTDVGNFVGDAVNELCPAGLPATKAWVAQQQHTTWS